MEERTGLRTNTTSYGTTGPPFEPNYLLNPDLERASLLSESAYMATATAPSPYPPGYAASAPMTAGADGPTAPLTEWPTIPGYEGMGAGEGGGFLPPPDLGPVPGGVMMTADNNWTIPFITEDMARRALLDYAKSKCCYGSTPAEQMDFRELRPYNTYRYRLETFTESRTCKWVTKPHTGEPVDSPVFGSPPMPWEIPIQVPAMFTDNTKKMPVPHTSSVKPCPQCLGICRTVCKKCHGTGRVRCWVCNGSGRRFEDACHHCKGCGTESCKTCNSTKYQTCGGCSGRGQILNYIQLTVTWKNHVFEFIVEHNSEFPTDLFRKVNGEKVFTDEQMLLPPLINFPAPSINQASQNGLQQHHSQFTSSSRILRQRHTVEWLPLTKVEYAWKGNPHDYFVYGKENKVYTDNYPQKCCCCSCCVIM